MLARQIQRLRTVAAPAPSTARLLSTSRAARDLKNDPRPGNNPPGPTNESRISPKEPGQPDHPGYVSGKVPPSSTPPSSMPGPDGSARPSSMNPTASTAAAPPHQGVHEMAKGAEK